MQVRAEEEIGRIWVGSKVDGLRSKIPNQKLRGWGRKKLIEVAVMGEGCRDELDYVACR